jgi:hypothetical protein
MVGESVETKDGEIVLGQGRLSVRLEGAAVWYPRLKPIVGDGQGDATALVWAIHDALEGEKITSLFLRKTGDAEGLEGVFADRCRLVAEDLRQAWRLGDAQTVALAIQSAVGLGSGLTPSGDDFVVGFLGAAQCFAYGSEVEGGVRRSLSLDKSMTTLPSYFMLRGALAGFLPEPLTDLLHAVGRRSRRRILYSVRRLAGLGASSGQDMLAGVVCYLEAAGTVGVTG